MKIRRETPAVDVAFAVCTALHRAGITAVLTGGNAAALYAPAVIRSDDLDFVVTLRTGEADPDAALLALGYELSGVVYRHRESLLLLEFPPGPLSIASEVIATWSTLRRGAYRLHVLDRTDSCRDRLAAFLFWNDRQSLAQAVEVARADEGDLELERIRAWCEREGELRRFEEFRRLVRG